jgi:hypothetical protein
MFWIWTLIGVGIAVVVVAAILFVGLIAKAGAVLRD